MTKHDIAQQIVEIQEILEIARDNVIEERRADAKVILQRAIAEIKKNQLANNTNKSNLR
ncbi:TetR/AcrR family transcriptional regulator C-terminal ligand-binding domain-containing protein [Pasteurella multocida]|uniref:TetR/AcrR family transcriptional regulator C-terminal ligand-binding domain-containing protein n=1 Tax=Pasteurella multocida TaxID=747 RepID=UPI0020210A62|nr:TetR/AcrR family transcriptional regulator C-terminal ligand-binding domain-containing protein [Pasteurella multocida]MCL7770049.1 TetR/AcrR family transcriptional regulator C-terminal ligand-binding domain-containing protein [Pasteurella multocida]MDX3951966.1 TetR/AcrR family transcriptional regulator C-terminal ligand-binding domain-containing protein [Pasteurella multocida]